MPAADVLDDRRTTYGQRQADYRTLRHELGDRALTALQREAIRPLSTIRDRAFLALVDATLKESDAA